MAHKNTIQNAADILGISEHTCQSICNYYADAVLEAKDPEPLRLLGIDDIACKKGHSYNTVVYNQETSNVIAIITGRTKEDVINYFMSWPEDVRLKIEAISMDMSKGYCSCVLECFLNAKPVIDRFHIAQLLHKSVDDKQKHIQNRIKKDGKSGCARRTPAWMQQAGLEWFYRFIQEPRRIWKRYLVNNTIFFMACIEREVVQQ